jgi:hypothetical protein
LGYSSIGTCAWLGIGPLDFDQRIDAGAAFRQLIGTHAFLAMKLRAAPYHPSPGPFLSEVRECDCSGNSSRAMLMITPLIKAKMIVPVSSAAIRARLNSFTAFDTPSLAAQGGQRLRHPRSSLWQNEPNFNFS